jgi:hypothetical protein
VRHLGGPNLNVDHVEFSGRFRVDAAALPGGGAAGAAGVTVGPQQLRINQRISQAAIRRLNVLVARLDGTPPPASREGGSGGAARVTVSARQLLINQRISQAAVRRANTLAGRREGILPSPTPEGSRSESARLTVSARQLLINQRISQAAVRRANALGERIPAIPFPPPGPTSQELDDVIGTLPDGARSIMRVSTIRHRGALGDGRHLPGRAVPASGGRMRTPWHRGRCGDLAGRSDIGGDGAVLVAAAEVHDGAPTARAIAWSRPPVCHAAHAAEIDGGIEEHLAAHARGSRRRAVAQAREHAGIVLASARRWPRTRAGLPALARAIETLLELHPEADALRGLAVRLPLPGA